MSYWIIPNHEEAVATAVVSVVAVVEVHESVHTAVVAVEDAIDSIVMIVDHQEEKVATVVHTALVIASSSRISHLEFLGRISKTKSAAKELNQPMPKLIRDQMKHFSASQHHPILKDALRNAMEWI